MATPVEQFAGVGLRLLRQSSVFVPQQLLSPPRLDVLDDARGDEREFH
jgi:hypothetical protein